MRSFFMSYGLYSSMKMGTDVVDEKSFRNAKSVSVAPYGSVSGIPKSGQKTSITSELLPEPGGPQMKRMGNEPTASIILGFIGVAKNQPRIGRTTSERSSCRS